MNDKECNVLVAVVFALSLLMLLVGCTSTITHYDGNGNITKIEKVTNASRFYDGTNEKSQMVLVDAVYLKSDISATAGEAYTPGWTLTFVNGKSALLNMKDEANFEKAESVVEKFFKEIKVGKDGVETK
jgi:hypothetical protein